jgi:hypothetical protein
VEDEASHHERISALEDRVKELEEKLEDRIKELEEKVKLAVKMDPDLE